MKNLFTIHNSVMLLIDHQQGTIQLARNMAYVSWLQMSGLWQGQPLKPGWHWF